MTINDNSTKSINAAIIDLQNQIKQLQHKIGILSNNQLKENDIEFPDKVEYADEAGKAKEADHAKTADTAKYTSETENAVHARYADNATKATQDGSGNVITDTYATKTELTSGLSGKADKSHTHTKSEITDFPTSLPANGGIADSAKMLKPFAYWNYPYEYDEINGIRYFVFKIQMASWFSSILIQVYSDINYALSRKYILGLWRHSNYGYNVSVTDLGGTINDALIVWLGNDGNVYLQAKCEWTSGISFSKLETTDITIETVSASRFGSNTDSDGSVLFTPLTDPIIDCGVIRGASDLSSAWKEIQYLKADKFTCSTGTFTENITAPNITSLEQRVAALESNVKKAGD